MRVAKGPDNVKTHASKANVADLQCKLQAAEKELAKVTAILVEMESKAPHATALIEGVISRLKALHNMQDVIDSLETLRDSYLPPEEFTVLGPKATRTATPRFGSDFKGPRQIGKLGERA